MLIKCLNISEDLKEENNIFDSEEKEIIVSLQKKLKDFTEKVDNIY